MIAMAYEKMPEEPRLLVQAYHVMVIPDQAPSRAWHGVVCAGSPDAAARKTEAQFAHRLADKVWPDLTTRDGLPVQIRAARCPDPLYCQDMSTILQTVRSALVTAAGGAG